MSTEEDNWWEQEANEYQANTSRTLHAADGDVKPVVRASNSITSPMLTPIKTPSSLGRSESDVKRSFRLDSTATTSGEYEDDSDFDGGDDNDSLWVECSETGSDRRVWYNRITRVITFDDPAELRASSTLSNLNETKGADSFYDHDEDEIVDRRNSLILSGAWGNDKGTNWARGSQGAAFTPAVAIKKPTQVVKAVSSIHYNVDMLLDLDDDELPPGVSDLLREVRYKMQAVSQVFEEEEAARDDRKDVDALVEFDKLLWNFENPSVHAFRARATRVPHKQYLFRNWHMPQYMSQFPVPAESKGRANHAVVHFGSAADSNDADDYDAGACQKYTSIAITSEDTVQSCIHKSFPRYTNSMGGSSDVGTESQYVLKARGLNDFMDGDNKLMDFEYVRDCLRHHEPIELELVRRPEPGLPKDAKDDEGPEDYRAKVLADIPVLTLNDYANISSSVPWSDRKVIPMHEMPLPFRIRICGVDNATQAGLPRLDSSIPTLFVRVMVFHGMETIGGDSLTTTPVPACCNPRWMQWVYDSSGRQARMVISTLPRATRLAFLLYGRLFDKEELLGFTVAKLVDEKGHLMSGRNSYRMWGLGVKQKEGDLSFIYRSTTRDNLNNRDAAVLTVQFDEYLLPVVAPVVRPLKPVRHSEPPSLSRSDKGVLKKIVNYDLLQRLNEAEKKVLWTHRFEKHLMEQPLMLVKVLTCVDWTNKDMANEAYFLMREWASFEQPADALQLLDCKFADYRVRDHAITILKSMPDYELQQYLLQLTQCLKFEPYHDSPLARFMIERSLRNPYQVGHHFFWHLKAELASPDFCERYAVILEEYLSHAGQHTRELRKQNQAVLKLQRVAELVLKLKLEHKRTDSQCMEEYYAELDKLNRRFFSTLGHFQMPLNPKWEATTLIVEKCRYMSSKKIPLWLVFNNRHNPSSPIYVIFKSGDDLRQDILTLQLLRIMDRIWLGDGLDMRLTPYRCIATGVNDDGEGVGMIEVVMNSDTTSGIQLKYGGGAIGALKLEPLDSFLRDHNKGPDYEQAVDTFIRSCAGYCVATFVLGIGDRHNGNIMVTKDGHLFHIDFGHFLGNFKKKFGFNRERAAFVFTPEMAFVMGGKKYQRSDLFKRFKSLCAKAFNSLRKHAVLLENLFMLMVSAGMPELMAADDIRYLRDKLLLDMSDAEAEKAFRKEIKKSLDTTWRRIDNWIHNAKHG
jgi:Phosphatidylinositol 3- and 4-kinase/Phosphoinositide 3-kinase family, accessory domain (PIK domain)/PI3-kinase family, ras-binding domain/Phosphoinositide 3-kinase C2